MYAVLCFGQDTAIALCIIYRNTEKSAMQVAEEMQKHTAYTEFLITKVIAIMKPNDAPVAPSPQETT